ncbi:MAG: T9SS type A sorting domain-containing protein [Bacteroidia bacterium]
MKKQLFTLSIVVACFCKSNAQSFQLIDTTGGVAQSSYTFWVDTSSAYSYTFNIKNVTSSSISIKVKKYVISNSALDAISFCVGTNCYPPSTTLSAAVSIATNSVTTLLTDFTSVNTPNTAQVRYTVFNTNTLSDSISVTINYNVTLAAGIKQLGMMNDEVKIYPNPSNGLFNLSVSQFDNNKTTSIEIYNTIGECVHRQIITSTNCQIDVADLAEGIYMYSVLVGGEAIKTNRIIISR